jgi:hypothetical protein
MNSQLSIKKKLGKFCIVLTVPTRRVEDCRGGHRPVSCRITSGKGAFDHISRDIPALGDSFVWSKANEYRGKSNFPVASSASDNDVRLRGYNA